MHVPHLGAVFRIRDILVWIRIRIRGSMPLTNGYGSGFGSGSFFVTDLQDANKKKFILFFLLYYFLKIHLHLFSKIKSQKESQNSRNPGFSYYFCMMIEGSRSGSGEGSIPLTNGSGSRRPKNMWIRWIRIRIRNTALGFLRSVSISSSVFFCSLHRNWEKACGTRLVADIDL